MAAGMSVTVAPLNARLTTQEAADFLGISRPTLVRMLEVGKLPMTKPGRHRFVMLRDLLEFREKERLTRLEALGRMIVAAEEVDLYAKTDGPPRRTR